MTYRITWALWLILAVYVALAGMYSVVNPLFEAPDEIWHYEYIRWLVEGHGLPRPEDVGQAPWAQEGSQPPLYYGIAAALTAAISTDNAATAIRYNPHAAIGQADTVGNKNMVVHGRAEAWPWQGISLAAHVTRLFSILLGAVTVLCTYHTAQIIFPHRPNVSIIAALLVALNPQFLFLSAAINNDNLVTACCAVGVWLLAKRIGQLPASALSARKNDEWRTWVLIGLVTGAAALSKLSGLMLGVFAGLVLIWRAWRRRSLAEFIQAGLMIGSVAAVVAGWWYWRNWRLYGDPLGLEVMFAVLPGRAEPLTAAEMLTHVQGVWRSFWAVFGWFNVVADPWVYQAYSALSLAGVAGLIAGVALHNSRSDKSLEANRPAQIGLLLLWIGAFVLLVLRWTQISYPQGRLLFPAISAVATLLAWGLTNWLPARWHGGLAMALAAGMLPLATLAPWRWIAPAYAPPPLLPVTSTLPNPVAVDFGDQLRLQGYHWTPTQLAPGESLTLDLYWQALQPLATDYSIFVHLTDDNEILQAQRDSYPAAGALATSDWPMNAVISDQHQLTLPAVLPAPTRLRIDVGIYEYRSGQRLESPGADHWTLGYVEVLPHQDAEAQPVHINFDNQIALVNYGFDYWLLHPGEEFVVNLRWEALAAPRKDYVAFVHLILPPEAVWAQKDAEPQDGNAPTSTWRRGQQVDDQFVIGLPAELPPGLYTVEIGLYDPDSGERLKVDLSDAGVVLGQVRVVQE